MSFSARFHASAPASECVEEIVRHLTAEIAELSLKNEQDHDAVLTAHIRGQIKMARRILEEIAGHGRDLPRSADQNKGFRLPDGMGVALSDIPYGMKL